jgi:MFS family permease
MGIFVVFLTNGAHLAAIVGGFIAQHLGWRWCYWIPCIILGATWLLMLFCLPETLYHREPSTGHSLQHTRSRRDLFTFVHIARTRRLHLWDFTHCFSMLRYPSITLCGLYYSIAFGLGSVLFAVTGSAAFSAIYHFDPAQVGLAIGLSTFIGTCIGELASGPVSDRIL